MQHMINTMSADVSKCGDNVWYVDSGASNHMTSHGEWFKELQALLSPSYVDIGDDTAHPIAHSGNVPLSLQDGNVKYLADVLHVPNITKNLVSVGVKWLSRGCRYGSTLMDCTFKNLKRMGSWLHRTRKWAECSLWM